MKISPYIEKLNNSDQFKDFEKSNNDAYIIAGFFILDLETGKNIHQLDYYLPKKKKVAAFNLDGHVTFQILDLLTDKVPEKLEIKTKVDLDQLKGILEDEMKNRGITDDIKKIIAVLQCVEGKKVWNLNCILSGMGVLNAHVEDESRSVLKMEKKSFMDIMKKIPKQMQQTEQMQAQSVNHVVTKDEAKEKIKQLEELKKAIDKEEKAINEMAIKTGKNAKPKSSKILTPKVAKAKKSK